MMYGLAKLAEAVGLGIILYAFLQHFPKLMNPKIFLAGIIVFLCGWMVEHFLLKR